eukprot:CAMPEP_0182878260 /NCGR_PEP_ID=MMETSP0034_2-20130328/15246_1 /TAXON_ID=156128 /ORGANISM="Nephroselmis pyriformis, Strain CCMP717" /LENGTH=504 /DNA_ID=CAMNT_0025011139 /DNA_START=43 /DNA_END=1554 /DNA_ORIENTATION=+
MRAAWSLALVALALAALREASAKYVAGDLHLSSLVSEIDVAKFSFSYKKGGTINGTWHTAVKGWGRGRHNPGLFLYSDDAWERFQNSLAEGSLCNHRTQMATQSHRIRLKPNAQGDEFVSSNFHFNIDVDRERTRYWYALVADCELEWYDARNLPPLQFELEFRNGGSHLPADETGMYTLQWLVLLIMLAFGAFCTHEAVAQFRQKKQIHLIVLLLGVAYVLQMGSIFSEIMHLTVYLRNGRGLRLRYTWFAADAFSEVLQGLSELLISLLLIFLACGWTTLSLGTVADVVAAEAAKVTLPDSLTEKGSFLDRLQRKKRDLFEDKGFKRMATQFTLALRRPVRLMKTVSFGSIFLVSIVGTQVFLEVMGRKFHESDDFLSFHDHEHWPGFALIGLRCLLCLLFLMGGHFSRQSAKSDPQVYEFLQRLHVLGCVWLLSFPVLVYVASWLPPYNRHAAVSGGSLLSQGVALALMAVLVMRNEKFKNISSLSDFNIGAAGGLDGKRR